MELYEAIYKRRIVRDFKNEIVPDETLKRIINAGIQAPTHDHLRNWEFVILKEKEDKERALQFIKRGVEPQLEILKQYSMLMNASHIILPFFKSNSGVLKPSCVSSLNPITSIWCVIENMFLAATAEGLACSMRIPVGEEGKNVADILGAPENYLLPCYIGLGYPAEDKPEVEQVQYTAEQKMHLGKW